MKGGQKEQEKKFAKKAIRLSLETNSNTMHRLNSLQMLASNT